jgi:hypothetical protein
MNRLAKSILAIFISIMLVFTGIVIWAEWRKNDLQVYEGYGREIYLGDLNGDGLQDIVDDGGRLIINTGGAFKIEKITANLTADLRLVKDVDEDGKAELLAVKTTSVQHPTLFIGRYKGDGVIEFEKGPYLNHGWLLGAEDTDNDGQLEYITYGDFEPGGCFVDERNGYRMSIEVADLDGDGDKDLTLNTEDSTHMCLFENDGTGNFSKRAVLPIGRRTGSMAIGDFNGDGRPDIAAIAWNEDLLVTYLNQGGWSFSKKTYDAPDPSVVRAGDLDSDGDLDLVVSDFDGDSIVVRMNDGKGNFDSQNRYNIDGTLYETRSALLFDMDNDGDIDFAGITFGWGVHIVVMKNDGQGRFIDMKIKALETYSTIIALLTMALVAVWYHTLVFMPKRIKIGPAREAPENAIPIKKAEIAKKDERSGKDNEDLGSKDASRKSDDKGGD